MRKHNALGMAGVLFLAAACSDLPTSPAEAPQFSRNGVSSPNTDVTASFTIAIGATVEYRGSGPGNNNLGTCHTVNGVVGLWYNPQSRRTSPNPHPHCANVAGVSGSIQVTFFMLANYVLASNGNVNLNFTLDPITLAPRGLQYKKTGDYTQGFGVLVQVGDSGDAARVWTINLTQPLLNDTGNLIVRTGTLLEACNTDLGCHPGAMIW